MSRFYTGEEEQNEPIDPAKFFPLDRDGRYETAIDALQYNDYRVGEVPRTLVEIELCKFAGAIRDRQLWWEKLNNETIVSKWRGEVGGAENAEKFDYAIAECKWQAEHYKGPARPAGAEGVFAIQNVQQSLLQRLLDGIQHIRNNGRRDEHPGSDGIVVDIIHPSLYAYEQGVTPVLGDAQVYEMPPWESFVMNKAAKPEDKLPEPEKIEMCSKFGLQWLPAEFLVKKRENTDDLICEINSYINSLHPITHSSMYGVIGEAFLKCIPLFEEVLTELGEPGKPHERPLRVDDKYEWRVEPAFLSDDEYEDNDSFWARGELNLPKVPKEFKPPPIPEKVTLLEKQLQVIVKIASIELTPEKPSYKGGSWHVEGMRNERIVATACMYLESDNCAESMLEFRAACHEPENYHQNDDPGVLAMYGLVDKEPLVQSRGVCRTLAGRVLAWPNTLQHRVRPFELADKSRNGRRMILCFFLVDPTLRIRSTATVPPQIREWQEVAMEKLLPSKVPTEVAAQITAKLDGLSYEDACERRSRLMSERTAVMEVEDWEGSKFFERTFSLCEH